MKIREHKIIGLTGYARSGKDHTCQRIIEEAKKKGVEFKRYALADFLKELMCIVLDMSLEELNAWKDADTKNRQRLIDFSEKGIKTVDPAFWVKKFETVFLENPGNYIITDIRYYVEYHYMKDFLRRSGMLKSFDYSLVYVNRDHPDVYTKCGMEIAKNHADIIYENFESNEAEFQNLCSQLKI